MIYNLFHSTNPNKKYMVQFANEVTGRLNKIHFGSFGHHDYTLLSSIEKHQNVDSKKRKELYKLRHANDNINDLSYPGGVVLASIMEQEDIRKINNRYGKTI